MVEVKGRASMVWYWSGVGAVVSLFGLWSLDWVDDLGRNTMGKINKRKLRAPFWEKTG